MLPTECRDGGGLRTPASELSYTKPDVLEGRLTRPILLWSHIPVRITSIFAVSLAMCFASESNASDRSFETWSQLWTLCRSAVELGVSLKVEGLIDLGPSIKIVPPLTVEGLDMPLSPGWEAQEHTWQYPGSALVVVEEVMNSSPPRRACFVKLAPDTPAVTPDEEADFAAEFMKQSRSLIVAGTHEERNPAPIFSTNLGVGPFARSANGCSIISGLPK